MEDAIINYDSDKEEETKTMDNYAGHKELFSVDDGLVNEAINIMSLKCFELFFNKDVIQLTVIETKRYAEQYRNPHIPISSAVFSSCHRK